MCMGMLSSSLFDFYRQKMDYNDSYLSGIFNMDWIHNQAVCIQGHVTSTGASIIPFRLITLPNCFLSVNYTVWVRDIVEHIHDNSTVQTTLSPFRPTKREINNKTPQQVFWTKYSTWVNFPLLRLWWLLHCARHTHNSCCAEVCVKKIKLNSLSLDIIFQREFRQRVPYIMYIHVITRQ